MTHESIRPQRSIGAVPDYSDIHTYVNDVGSLNIWEGDGWKKESLSWKTGCYLAINLAGPMELTIHGPGAQEFLSKLAINNVNNWSLGTSKHLVMTDEEGLIVSHGLSVRDSKDSFRLLAALPWPAFYAQQHGADGLEVQFSWRDIFILQLAGPAIVEVVAAAAGEEIRELPFLGTRPIEVAGAEGIELELGRIGMTGSIAYEIRGAYEDGPAVFDALYRIGQEFGITRLGYRTYPVNHTEGGFPQMGFHFVSSVYTDTDYRNSEFALSLTHEFSGSIDPTDVRARLRTPSEVNWSWMAKFDHEFIGRAAVEAEVQNRRRKTVILRWNADDVLDVFASYLRPGEEYAYIEFPSTPQAPAGGHADLITKNGVPVGISSAAVYSYSSREMISQATIDLAETEVGTELVLHWGDYGGRIKEIRTTVAPFPYLELPRNADVDTRR
ncbi:hypothetical protein ABS642_10630 [Microbacterium sp. A8/3-1]|uniref:GCVT N-terminal domain-containing protein n=1 Tax=Microbacterium sp. A8/3-1 TaxID=3160749 RepID=A0AAU7W3L3_9MICO